MQRQAGHGPPPPEEEIDALFASESDRVRDAAAKDELPNLIFTQAADRNVQQFADESACDAPEPAPAMSLFDTEDEAPSFADEPLYFAETRVVSPIVSETLVGSDAVPEPVFQPVAPLPPRAVAPRMRLVAGAAAVMSVTAILFVFVVADRPRGDEPAAAAPRRPATTATAPGSSGRGRPPAPAPSPPAGRPVAAPAAASGTAVPPSPAPTAKSSPPVEVPENNRPPSADGDALATRQAGVTSPLSRQMSMPAPPAPASGTASSMPEPALRTVPPPALPQADAGPAAAIGTTIAPPEIVPAASATERDGPVAARVNPGAVRAAAAEPKGVAPVEPAALERGQVRALLARYETAYSDLDASAAANLYPGVDRKALSRAFSALTAQQVLFEDCRIQIAGASATATCAGTATWTPKVGGGSRSQERQWQFDLQQVAGEWRIGAVRVK